VTRARASCAGAPARAESVLERTTAFAGQAASFISLQSTRAMLCDANIGTPAEKSGKSTAHGKIVLTRIPTGQIHAPQGHIWASLFAIPNQLISMDVRNLQIIAARARGFAADIVTADR
jgi:hypothetical protein